MPGIRNILLADAPIATHERIDMAQMKTPELKAMTLVGNEPGPRMLVTGGVHGDEFEPMAAIRALPSRVTLSDLKGTIVLIPVVNESAFECQNRCATDRLDLARTFPGSASGSLTERIAFALTRFIRDADFFVDLHTGGTKLSVTPFAGYMLHADSRIRETQKRMAVAFNLPLVWGTDPSLNGRSLSAARDAGVPAIYAEYLGSGSCDGRGVEAYIDGCLNVLAEVGMMPPRTVESRVECVIEDPRLKSGHMQIQNPAPEPGFFEPAVDLGQKVIAGELLGTISDPLGENPREIRAETSGIVLVLRTFPRVEAGDSLAVIADPASGTVRKG